MNPQIMKIMINFFEKEHNSLEKQREYLELVKFILILNQDVIKKGLNVLDNYIKDNRYPILSRGLLLILQGTDPNDVQRIIINTIIVNNTDFLSSMIILEGIIAIQENQNPYLTKELIKSYFTLEFDSIFEEDIKKINLESTIQVLDSNTINILLNKANDNI
jgi:flagellar motor component MotA